MAESAATKFFYKHAGYSYPSGASTREQTAARWLVGRAHAHSLVQNKRLSVVGGRTTGSTTKTPTRRGWTRSSSKNTSAGCSRYSASSYATRTVAHSRRSAACRSTPEVRETPRFAWSKLNSPTRRCRKSKITRPGPAYLGDDVDWSRVFRSNPNRTYRGWVIESVDATQLGYRLGEGGRSRPGRGRKQRLWLIHYPEGGTKAVDSLSAAKQYIDDYLGPP